MASRQQGRNGRYYGGRDCDEVEGLLCLGASTYSRPFALRISICAAAEIKQQQKKKARPDLSIPDSVSPVFNFLHSLYRFPR